MRYLLPRIHGSMAGYGEGPESTETQHRLLRAFRAAGMFSRKL